MEEKKKSIFREAALEYRRRAVVREGDVLRITPQWIDRAQQLLFALLAVAFIFGLFGRLHEYASGPAVVRLEGKREVTVVAAGLVESVEVLPGQRVEAGATLIRMVTREELSSLQRVEQEFELQLLRFLRDPSDSAARQSLTSLRAELELARSRVEQRSVKAPFTGIVGDVRVQPGQYLASGAPALSLVAEDAQATLLAFIPGYYRPFLRAGMPLRVELEGFRHEYLDLSVESVSTQVVGPNEVRRYLGAEIGDALVLEGPLVLVRARLPPDGFVSGGRVLGHFDGMPARVQTPVRSERLLLALVPGLKELTSHEQ